jgi:hypothetical protein
MSLKPCLDCRRLSQESRCPTCRSRRQRERDADRGSPAARGYDHRHRRLRGRWAPKVAAGIVDCARCGLPILPGQPWDLGHQDDRRLWSGPEHQHCNRSAGGRNGWTVTSIHWTQPTTASRW